jgi:asparagine synthase (glutamine-hydrolysing)
MNSASMAFYIPFLEAVKNRYEQNILYLTGDGGDKTLPRILPPLRFKSIDALTRYLINRHYVIPVETVAALLNLGVKDVNQSVYNRISEYPEKNISHRYVHFMIYERGMKWLFEGEDRNRCFLPSATPFYDLEFFSRAMSCPERYKKNHRLYGAFLKKLSPEAAGIVDMNRMAPVISSRYRQIDTILSLLSRYPEITRRIKSRLSPPTAYNEDSPAVIYIKSVLDQAGVLDDLFDISQLRRICQLPEDISRIAFNNLLTIVDTTVFYRKGEHGLVKYKDFAFNR